MESAIYQGDVFHQRFVPTQHQFKYRINLFWLKLCELDQLDQQLSLFSVDKRNWVECRQRDYITSSGLSMHEKALTTAQSLGLDIRPSAIYFLGQLRMLGFYFSPVNFYFFQDDSQQFTHMLAEVTNTPWHEKHCYLVNIKQPEITQKQFHVSPFNPLDMTYHWQIAPPGQSCHIALSCHQQDKHFTAGVNLTRQVLNPSSLKRVLLNTPSMSAKTVLGIYWQALKIWAKGTPLYDHPNKGKNNHV